MDLVVVGAGKIGSQLIEIATGDGNDVVVIERDEGVANRISARYDCLVLCADATSEGTLQEAGIDRADAVISTTNVDAVNVMVMLLAQEHEVPALVSVVHEPEHIQVFDKIGVNVIENPQRLIAKHLFHSVRHPAVVDFMELGDDAEVFEIVVGDGAPITGVTLATATAHGLFPEESLVVAIQRAGEVLFPSGESEIEGGDLVTLFARTSRIDELAEVFGNGA